MGMGIGINVKKPDAGAVKGTLEPVACGVWFTSTGRVMPRMIKYRTREGGFEILEELRVLSVQEKNYCGIPALEYECESWDGERKRWFRLLYYVERREWKLLWK